MNFLRFRRAPAPEPEMAPEPLVCTEVLIQLRDITGEPQQTWIRATPGQLLTIERGELDVPVKKVWERPTAAAPTPTLAELVDRIEKRLGIEHADD